MFRDNQGNVKPDAADCCLFLRKLASDLYHGDPGATSAFPSLSCLNRNIELHEVRLIEGLPIRHPDGDIGVMDRATRAHYRNWRTDPMVPACFLQTLLCFIDAEDDFRERLADKRS